MQISILTIISIIMVFLFMAIRDIYKILHYFFGDFDSPAGEGSTGHFGTVLETMGTVLDLMQDEKNKDIAALIAMLQALEKGEKLPEFESIEVDLKNKEE